ncbi:MAG: hypothetical protein HGA97_06870 [Chlorobiaceae bacterium]|nr:hypothetical protein [Chlorobiaceae bacterium]
MKWPLRIFGVVLLFTALVLFGAWVTFPWYAQALLDRLTTGKGVVIELRNASLPRLSGAGFGRMQLSLSTPPDSCTAIAMHYKVSLLNGKLTWHRVASSATPAVDLFITADSVLVHQMPSDIRFSQARPLFRIRLDTSAKTALLPSVSPDSIAFAVRNGRVETGQLRLEGISYNVLLTRSDHYVQQPARFKGESLFSGNIKSPMTDFEASFGMAHHPRKPCTLTFSNCSVALYGIRASAPLIEYSLRNKRTAFDLKLDNVPLERLFADPQLVASGKLNGSIPIEFLDSSLTIEKGCIDASKGSTFTFRGAKGSGTQLVFDAGRHTGGPPLIGDLSLRVNLDAKNEALSSIRLASFSARLFEGRVSAKPAVYNLKSGKAAGSLTIDKVPLLDRIRLQGELSGSMNGTVSGKIPVDLDRNHIMLRKARLSVQGGGSLRQLTPPKPSKEPRNYSIGNEPVQWSFSDPSVTVDMAESGKTTLVFALKTLNRKMGGGELLLSSPKGMLTLTEISGKPAILSLNGFTTGLLDGSVSIDRADYDLRSRSAETEIALQGIPIQKLIDLQGTSAKLAATGTLKAKIPIKIDGNAFSIPKGALDAEHEGLIVYSSSPEERAIAGAGMRLTYEALGNFNYTELLSTIVMTPDGDSQITVQLKGRNPDFQNNREVHLNLNIEQNLLDLFKSLSIASDIEESISEQTLKATSQKKRKGR